MLQDSPTVDVNVTDLVETVGALDETGQVPNFVLQIEVSVACSFSIWPEASSKLDFLWMIGWSG